MRFEQLANTFKDERMIVDQQYFDRVCMQERFNPPSLRIIPHPRRKYKEKDEMRRKKRARFPFGERAPILGFGNVSTAVV